MPGTPSSQPRGIAKPESAERLLAQGMSSGKESLEREKWEQGREGLKIYFSGLRGHRSWACKDGERTGKRASEPGR